LEQNAMIDIKELNDMLGHLAPGQDLGAVLDPNTMTELLGQIGVDPAAIEGMSSSEIIGLLSENGIDLSQVTEADLSGLIEQYMGQGGLADIAREAVQNGGIGEMVQGFLGRILGR
jgi:hypothetical protein